jgi:hypothetical protein
MPVRVRVARSSRSSAQKNKDSVENGLLVLARLSLSDDSHLQVVAHFQQPPAMISNRFKPERPSTIKKAQLRTPTFLDGDKPQFPDVVHLMMSQVDIEDPTIMCWVCDGEAFVIDPSHPCLGEVLSKYFQRKCIH